MLLRAGDIISGQQGKATANINGVIEDMFYLKSFEAIAEKNKTDVNTLGDFGTQSKAKGYKGTGSMTIYYVTSRFRQLMLDYIKTGKDTYFTITITNDDPSSTVGKQTTVIYNVNLDSVTIAKLDVDADSLEEDVSFTWSGAEILESFVQPTV